MDNLFWLGRYAERTENLVRVLRAVVLRLGDDIATTIAVPQSRAARASAERRAGRGGVDDRARLQAELQAVVFDRNAPGGLQNLFANVRRTAWAARDRLSPDTWRTIHTLTGPAVNDAAEGFDAAEALLSRRLVRRAAALSGLSAENMTRGPNRLFVDLGRRIERASHLAWLVRQTMARAESGEEDRSASCSKSPTAR